MELANFIYILCVSFFNLATVKKCKKKLQFLYNAGHSDLKWWKQDTKQFSVHMHIQNVGADPGIFTGGHLCPFKTILQKSPIVYLREAEKNLFWEAKGRGGVGSTGVPQIFFNVRKKVTMATKLVARPLFLRLPLDFWCFIYFICINNNYKKNLK